MVFSGKKIFTNKNKDFHVGMFAPEDFKECSLEDLKEFIKDLKGKKIWRCHFCNDLSIMDFPLEDCPTCNQEFAYVEIDLAELKHFLELK